MTGLAGPSLPILGRRVMLTALTEADEPRVLEAMTSEWAHRWLDSPWPYTAADAREFVRDFAPAGWRGEHGERIWAIRESLTGALAGVISLDDDTALVGYWLHPDSMGRGLASDAVRTAVGHAEGCLTWDEVRWRCLVGNVGSMRVARAVGFAFVGTSVGAWRGGELREQYDAVLRAAGPPAGALPWPDETAGSASTAHL